MHINLSSASWSKVGEVSSEGQGDDNLSASPSPTPPTPAESPTPSKAPVLKTIKLSGVKCVKNAKKITGKLSVQNAAVRIKVGKKAYKKASVKGKKFTLKLNYRLKKKTKVTVRITKEGYKPLVFKFGAEKGRILLVVSYLVPAAVCLRFYQFLIMLDVETTEKFVNILLCCSPFAALLWFFAMYKISCRIFDRKEL